MTITQEELKKLLHYDPETGVFTWLVSRRGTAKAGSVAGGVKKSNGSIYASIRIYHRGYQAHRLAWLYMTGEFPREGEIIKHIDGDVLDSRWCNLVKTVQAGTKSRNNKSEICGVVWERPRKKWRVTIRADGKEAWIGRYDTIFEAVCARKSAELKIK